MNFSMRRGEKFGFFLAFGVVLTFENTKSDMSIYTNVIFKLHSTHAIYINSIKLCSFISYKNHVSAKHLLLPIRTHEGCDCCHFDLLLMFGGSIHTHTRSATLGQMALATKQICFNPRTHEGCDSYCFY